MLHCAFLTLDDSTGFVIDDELAYAPLADLGWRVETISWRTPSCDWRAYDAVVIRSTWDYITDPERSSLFSRKLSVPAHRSSTRSISSAGTFARLTCATSRARRSSRPDDLA